MRRDKAIKCLRHAMNFADIFSKDRSTKVGAVFFDPTDYTIITQGYNGFPRNINDDLAERHERPLKYEYTEHAERNAFFNLARQTLKDSIVVTTEALTMSAVRANIAVGAKEVYSPRPREMSDQHCRAIALLTEAGVQAFYHDGEKLEKAHANGWRARKVQAFLADAHSLARNHAKDPYAGATPFLSPDDMIQLTSGYSGMPRRANDSRMERYEGEERVYWVEDSFRNAIYNSVSAKLAGCYGAISQEPCSECFRGVAAVGCSKVISPEPAPDFASRWASHLARTREMAEELDIELISIPAAELAEVTKLSTQQPDVCCHV